MPTTGGGIAYPSPTDVPDVPTDLQELANSIEAGNPVVTTGFVVAANWTLNSFRIQRRGGLIAVAVQVTRTVAALSVPAGTGDVANVLWGTLPAGYWPAFTQPLCSSSTGRVTAGFVQASDGGIYHSAFAGDGTNVIVGDSLSLGGVFFL